jgi:hypothetical protein
MSGWVFRLVAFETLLILPILFVIGLTLPEQRLFLFADLLVLHLPAYLALDQCPLGHGLAVFIQ